MLTPHEQEALQMATICSDCRWGIFFRQEHDSLIVRLEEPFCGHASSLLGRNYVSGEYLFQICHKINTGNCSLYEPKSNDGDNIISHDGLVMNSEGKEEE